NLYRLLKPSTKASKNFSRKNGTGPPSASEGSMIPVSGGLSIHSCFSRGDTGSNPSDLNLSLMSSHILLSSWGWCALSSRLLLQSSASVSIGDGSDSSLGGRVCPGNGWTVGISEPKLRIDSSK